MFKISKTNNRSIKKGKVIKFDNKLYIKYNNNLYHPDILLNDDKITLYALPSNTYHEIGKSTLTDVIAFKKNYDTIMKYWHYIKPDMKVKGTINDNKFIINFKAK